MTYWRTYLAAMSIAVFGPTVGWATATYDTNFQAFLAVIDIKDATGVSLLTEPTYTYPVDIGVTSSGNAYGAAGFGGGTAGIGVNVVPQSCSYFGLRFGCSSLGTYPLPFSGVSLTDKNDGNYHYHRAFGSADGTGGFTENPQSYSNSNSLITVTNNSSTADYTIDFLLTYIYGVEATVSDLVNEWATSELSVELLTGSAGNMSLVGLVCDSRNDGASCQQKTDQTSIFSTDAPTYSFTLTVEKGSSDSVGLNILKADGQAFSPYAPNNAVPVPPTLILLSLGIAGMACQRRWAQCAL
jgi:hypothetical protein